MAGDCPQTCPLGSAAVPAGQLSLPGFVNAHSHAFQRAMRGRAEGDDFWAWRDVMLGHARGLSPDMVRRDYAAVYREMRAAGFTAAGEFHYVGLEEAKAAAEAAVAAGLELVLLYAAYGRGGLDRFRQESATEYLQQVEELGAAGIRVGLAPHSVRACPSEWLEEIGRYADDPIVGLAPSSLTPERLAQHRHLVVTDRTVEHVDAGMLRTWVEGGGNLVLTDAALTWFDRAGLTADAADSFTVYLGHSDLQDLSHPLLRGVDWNARQTGEGIPVGYAMNEYPQWVLRGDAVGGLDLHVAGTTQGHPSLGTARVGQGTVHFIGAALPTPAQHQDHRWGLAPYAVTALTYAVFQNALDGRVEWVPTDSPFVPYYPADPLNAWREGDAGPDEPRRSVPSPGAYWVLASLALAGAVLVRRRNG